MESIRTEVCAILSEELELSKKDDPALIIRSSFDVIEDFLKQGMSLERIASSLFKHGFKIKKGHLVRHLGIVRAERGLEPLKRGKKPGAIPQQSATESVTPIATPAPVAPPVVETVAVAAPAVAPTAPARRNPFEPKFTYSEIDFDALPEDIQRIRYVDIAGERIDLSKVEQYPTPTLNKYPDQTKITKEDWKMCTVEHTRKKDFTFAKNCFVTKVQRFINPPT